MLSRNLKKTCSEFGVENGENMDNMEKMENIYAFFISKWKSHRNFIADFLFF